MRSLANTRIYNIFRIDIVDFFFFNIKYLVTKTGRFGLYIKSYKGCNLVCQQYVISFTLLHVIRNGREKITNNFSYIFHVTLITEKTNNLIKFQLNFFSQYLIWERNIHFFILSLNCVCIIMHFGRIMDNFTYYICVGFNPNLIYVYLIYRDSLL